MNGSYIKPDFKCLFNTYKKINFVVKSYGRKNNFEF